MVNLKILPYVASKLTVLGGLSVVQCVILLLFVCLANDLAEARTHLDAVRDWTARTGHLECILRAHLLAAEIARAANDLPGALAEARTGLHLADGCDYGRFAIDLLLALARIHLAIPEPRSALSRAREALDRAQQPDCQYAWAEADALHLCGLSHQALGESDLARQRFAAALPLRQRLGHPGFEHTRTLLLSLEGPA